MKKLDLKKLIISFITLVSLTSYISCAKYRTLEFYNGKIFYSKNITTDDLVAFKDFINKGNFSSQGKNRKIRIEKNDESYDLYFQAIELMPEVLDKLDFGKQVDIRNRWDDAKQIEYDWLDVSLDLSLEVFHDFPVNIHLCDKNLVTKRLIEGVDIDKYRVFNDDRSFTIIYSNYISEIEADKLLNIFNNWKLKSMNLLLHKNSEIYQIRVQGKDGVPADQYSFFERIADIISKEVFDGKVVHVYVNDENGKTMFLFSSTP